MSKLSRHSETKPSRRKTISMKSSALCAHKTLNQVRLLSPPLDVSLPFFSFPCSLDETIAALKKTVLKLCTELDDFQHKIYWQKQQCETLYADGHVIDVTQILLKIVRTANDNAEANVTIMDWILLRFLLHLP